MKNWGGGVMKEKGKERRRKLHKKNFHHLHLLLSEWLSFSFISLSGYFHSLSLPHDPTQAYPKSSTAQEFS